MIWAYEEYARMPGFAASAIKPKHLAASRRFYSGELDWATFNAGLPGSASDMLRPEFVATAATGQGRFWDTVEQVSAYRWKIQTPLRSRSRVDRPRADQAVGHTRPRAPARIPRPSTMSTQGRSRPASRRMVAATRR